MNLPLRLVCFTDKGNQKEGYKPYLGFGTGTGYLAFPMAEQYPECKIYGLDIVNETILRSMKLREGVLCQMECKLHLTGCAATI